VPYNVSYHTRKWPKMLTKEHISELKQDKNGGLAALAFKHGDSKEVLFILQNLGRVPKNFDADWVLKLLPSKNKNIRLWAVKTLGKIGTTDYLKDLIEVLRSDNSTEVRREAVSSIGRMRDADAIDHLIETLNDDDPKVVCQAIRGLLVFRSSACVDAALKPLARHENEMVRQIIEKEFGTKTKSSANEQPHPASWDFLKNVVVQGDVLDVLKHVPDESFHLTFTSPPYYNARDYSIYPSYQAYLDFLEKVFKMTHRKTKEGRFLIVNTSPIIIPRISRQHSSKRYPIPFDMHHFLVRMGWDFIDDIVWVKPESSVKNRNAGFLQHRKPLGYKPNARTEYLMVYRKHTEKLLDWNIRQYDFRTVSGSKVGDGYETSNVWEIDPTHDRVHSAVFPVDLCRRVIEYYSYKGDLVFDPFGGSGTFGRTAKSLDRFFFLTEKDMSYFEYMKTFQKKGRSFLDKETEFFTVQQFKKYKSRGAHENHA